MLQSAEYCRSHSINMSDGFFHIYFTVWVFVFYTKFVIIGNVPFSIKNKTFEKIF